MKSFVFLLLAGASLAACAQSGSPDQKAAIAKDAKAAVGDEPAFAAGSNAARAVAAIHRVNPKVKVEAASDAPLAGFQQVVVGGTVVYVSNDGKYLMQGSLYDTVAKRDLSEQVMAGVRREGLDAPYIDELEAHLDGTRELTLVSNLYGAWLERAKKARADGDLDAARTAALRARQIREEHGSLVIYNDREEDEILASIGG